MNVYEKIRNLLAKWSHNRDIKELLSVLSSIEEKLGSLIEIDKNEVAHNLVEQKIHQYLEEFYDLCMH